MEYHDYRKKNRNRRKKRHNENTTHDGMCSIGLQFFCMMYLCLSKRQILYINDHTILKILRHNSVLIAVKLLMFATKLFPNESMDRESSVEEIPRVYDSGIWIAKGRL